MASAFGARLRRLREAKKLTLQQVADASRLYQNVHMGTGDEGRPASFAERVQAIAKRCWA